MHLDRFDLNLLVALDALLTERNVTRAAERLHITQPAMSNALQRIRSHFNDPLLVRFGQEMKLTPMAADLALPVRELLSKAESVLSAEARFDPSQAHRTFRLILSDYCSAILMPPLAALLRTEAPGVRFEVEALNEHAIDKLLGGDADLFVSGSDLRLFDVSVDRDLLRRTPMFSDRFVCVVADDHPAVSGGLSREAYERSPHVVVKFGDGTMSIHEHHMQVVGLDVRSAVVVPSFVTLLLLLPGSQFVATVPERFASRFAPALGLRTLPCPIDIPDLVETAFWHPRLDAERGHLWLRDTIQSISRAL